ncbi:drug/metabolite transporter (DMT)-like permease [Nonomuraea muscovyensis]|uniref:Drug/metabolite transporter (DMT)-like permease n=1 Tax=Nonomuraea muscovyensis TaxID=1124761 RepID=A0A7X0C025_9ACTN|nr:DMT family transporter [Nonomuraea muscovyensis]MBB6344985.1 drug/metabolite transporter (DMT)-like permease [Nonomuraea muscovyensis]
MRSSMRSGVAGAASAMFLVGTLAGVSGLVKDYPVYGGQAVRYLVAAVVLLAVTRALGLRFVRLTGKEWALLGALSLLGLVIFNVCVVESARASGPALVGTVLGTVPLALALAGGRPAPRLLTGAGVVVAGATLATGLGSGTPAGLLWALGALAGEIGFSLLAIPLLPKLGAMRVSAYSTVLAVPSLAAIGLVQDGTGALRMPTFAEAAGFGYLAIVVTVVAFCLWYTSLPKLGPGRAGLFAGLIPLGAIVTGLVLGVATPSGYDLLGAGLVIAGIAVGLTAPPPGRVSLAAT